MWSAQVQFIWLPIKPQAWILTVITLVRDRFEFIVVPMCLKVKKKKKSFQLQTNVLKPYQSRHQGYKQTNKQTKPDDITFVQTLLIAPICSQSHCELFQISAHSTKQELLSQAFDHQRSLVFTKNSHNNTIHAQLIFLKWMKIFCSVVKLQGWVSNTLSSVPQCKTFFIF